MNKVTITFINNVSEVRSVKNAEVGRSYAEAIIQVFKHDGLIDTISRIDMIDLEDGYIDVLYEKEKENAKSNDLCNHSCTDHRCHHHFDLQKGDQR